MGYMGDKLYATEVASPIVFGASTLVVDGLAEAVFYATKVTSPKEIVIKKVDIL